ncbi:MAG: aspartate aminotransferase family protein [Chloroflexi bacterium]|nr:MAG: aspartate aminotransferase family protein [Chloroflexota bacterium]
MTIDTDASRRTSFVPGSPAAPFAVERAEGAYLITPEGRRILDAAGGAIVVNIGHGRREVAEVAAQALEHLTYVVPTFATEAKAGLVERLTERWLPERLTRASFTSGGSESVEAALRLARLHHVCAGRPERWKIIGREFSYHGVTLAALAVGGHASRRKGYEPLLLDFPKAPSHYCLECSLGRTSEDCRGQAADKLEEVIVREGPDTVAAFIAEPVVGGAAGAVVPPDGYWPRVAEICRKYGVLLIADEVMCGFGRTGEKFAVNHWNITPDIMVGGKGLAGGYAPIGGVYATDEVMAPIAERGEDLMFYTFTAHPASCAVADKVLEIMEREDLVARARSTGELLSKRLARLAQHPNVAEVRGLGLMQAVEIVRDRDTLERFPAGARITRRIVAAGLSKGVFLYPAGSGAAQDIIMLGPPFIITEDDIDLLVHVLEESIDEAVSRSGAARK